MYHSGRDGVSGGGCKCACGQGICGNSLLSAQFCYKPKSTLKNKVYLKN